MSATRETRPVNVISARAGYPLWAPSYASETAVSRLEDLTVTALGVPTARRDLLDVGCGTARRLHDTAAASAIGVDLAVEMLAGASQPYPLAAADTCALPFPPESFDVVWCRLVVGHLPQLETAYAELGRVCRDGGTVVVSDICPDAIAAGHRRSFRDANGNEHELEHFVHSPIAHTRAAANAGLALVEMRDGGVDESIRAYYEAAGRLAAYQWQYGQPIVRAFAWWKAGAVLR